MVAGRNYRQLILKIFELFHLKDQTLLNRRCVLAVAIEPLEAVISGDHPALISDDVEQTLA